MAGGGSSRLAGVSPNVVTTVLLLLGLGLAGYILGPPLYWHLAEALGRSSVCAPCSCDCSSQPLLSLPQELSNVTFSDCTKRDADVSEELDKHFTDLLAEDLELKEQEAVEVQQHADITLLEAKKLASQYLKEADKCNSGMDTCEEAREGAETSLLVQKKLSAMWEMRARQRGWKSRRAQA